MVKTKEEADAAGGGSGSSVDGGGESVDPADVFRINVECVPGVC